MRGRERTCSQRMEGCDVTGQSTRSISNNRQSWQQVINLEVSAGESCITLKNNVAQTCREIGAYIVRRQGAASEALLQSNGAGACVSE